MKKDTKIILWFILTTGIATLLNSLAYFLGVGITGLIFCIKYELREDENYNNK